jgi:hypothetical protein
MQPIRRKMGLSKWGVLLTDVRERGLGENTYRPRLSGKQRTPSVMKRTGFVAQPSDSG